MTDIVITTGIILLLISIVAAIIGLRLKGHNALSGTLPINGLLFIIGKASMAATIFMMLATTMGLLASPISVPIFFNGWW